MEYQKIGKSNINASRVILGLMRLYEKSHEEAVEIIKTAIDSGINFFDHANIYGRGKSEIVFAKAMKELNIPRNEYYLQSKVGIRHDDLGFDFRKESILNEVDKILARLETDYLDVLLLHRADMLWEPEQISEAFNELKASGKVLNFGVSNMHQDQINLLKKHLDVPIISNQLQFSIMHPDLVSTGVYVNTNIMPGGANSIGILDYLRLHDITMQAWSPFQYGQILGTFLGNKDYPKVNAKIDELAKKHNTTNTAIATSWILRHPANIQVVIGTMTPSRIIASADGTKVNLTHDEWYELYLASGNILP